MTKYRFKATMPKKSEDMYYGVGDTEHEAATELLDMLYSDGDIEVYGGCEVTVMVSDDGQVPVPYHLEAHVDIKWERIESRTFADQE